MKFRNLKISSQLNLGLIAIILLITVFGGIIWLSVDNIWNSAKDLYDHPLTVISAIGDVERNILLMKADSINLVYENDVDIAEEYQHNIETYEKHAIDKFSILYSQYLGPQEDVDNAYNFVLQCGSVSDETYSIYKSGDVTRAQERIKAGGVAETHWENSLNALGIMRDYANNRSIELYSEAVEHKEKNTTIQLLMIILTVLASIGVSIILVHNITAPLNELKSVAEGFRKGNLSTRSRYCLSNEFGILSNAINSMIEWVQSEIIKKDNLENISEIMAETNNINDFCQKVLNKLMGNTQSQAGAIYVLNETSGNFELYASIGLKNTLQTSLPSGSYSGGLGIALYTRDIQRIKDIPEDTELFFSTIYGDFKPKEIIAIPIFNQDSLIALISLVNIKEYSDLSIEFLNSAWGELAAHFNSRLLLRKMIEFSEELQSINSKLDAQAKELTIQADELTEQNIELEMQKMQLDEANQLKSTFLSNMSHELRTPLNSVIALASVLSRRLRGSIPEDEYSYLEVIERNGKNLLSMVNDILDLSRIEAGKEEVVNSEFRVQDVVAELVEMVRPQALEKNIGLESNIPVDFPVIRSDLIKCRHILQNLIANAVKFTDSGMVKITADVHEDEVNINIIDTGIGIAENQLLYIFDEFRQADETSSRSKGGIGLGLSISQKYARIIGGRISVKSKVKEGSTFTLALPIAGNNCSKEEDADQPQEVFGQERAIERLLDGKGCYVLIVEDSEAAIIQISDILTEQNYHYRVARNGKEALDMIDNELPDAIILDLMMPEVDGFEVLKSIRRFEKTMHIPVLILTAKHISKEELNFLKSNHVHQFIQKGAINKALLLKAVQDTLNLNQHVLNIAPQKESRGGNLEDKSKVLIIDDNMDNIVSIRALLQSKYDISVATGGHEGLEIAAKLKPPTILLDISMPEMDGFMVLEHIRSNPELKDTRVIALTARAMEGDRERILAQGFDDYVSKPVDEKLLEEAIRRNL